MTRFTPRRSSPRLASFDYVGSHAYHLIFNTRKRIPRFRDAKLVASCHQSLLSSTARYDVEVLAYCFMPTHLHLLVIGGDRAPLGRFAQHFKQATGHRYPGLWQRSYFDHILRKEEDVEAVARYIWHNPVRAGLAEGWLDYPYSGPRKRMPSSDSVHNAEDRAEALSLHLPRRGERVLEVLAWKH